MEEEGYSSRLTEVHKLYCISVCGLRQREREIPVSIHLESIYCLLRLRSLDHKIRYLLEALRFTPWVLGVADR